MEVLKDLARTIYREWFLKFRYPGQEDVPLTDSALGPIPQGWVVQPAGSLATFVGGSTTTKKSYVATGYLAFSAAGPDGRLDGYEIDGNGIVLSSVGSIRTYWAAGKWSSIANTIKILPTDPAVAHWLYLATESPDIWPRRGSAQPFVSINDARQVRLLVPPSATVEAFGKVATPIFDAIYTLGHQTEQLAKLRNHLLPKLVTGQIDVSTLKLDARAAPGTTDPGAVA